LFIKIENLKIKFYNVRSVVSFVLIIILVSSGIVTPFSYSVGYLNDVLAQEYTLEDEQIDISPSMDNVTAPLYNNQTEPLEHNLTAIFNENLILFDNVTAPSYYNQTEPLEHNLTAIFNENLILFDNVTAPS